MERTHFSSERKKTLILSVGVFLILIAVFGVFFANRLHFDSDSCEGTRNVLVSKKERDLRIVSTSPSITEALFAIGLGDCVVAVSDYCQYPPEVAELPKIGSLYEYNLESIIELNPDFVVVLKENDVLPQKLSALGVDTFKVDHTSLDGALASFESLGERVRNERPEALEQARRLREKIQRQIEDIRKSVADLPKTKTLVAIYRTVGLGKVSEVYVAGQNPYFNSVLEIVGAANVAENLTGVAPVVTTEGIIDLNPEVVLDLSTDGVQYDGELLQLKIEERVSDWRSLGDSVDAVKNGRIYPIFDDFATVPGARSGLFLEKVADLVHPERVKKSGDKESK